MRLDRIAAIVTLLATVLLITPWQGAFDRLEGSAAIAVPSASATPAPATLALLSAGAWWRVEPDYSFFLVVHDAFARRSSAPLISPMGPWAFLFRGWHPATNSVLLAAWLVLAATFWGSAWTLGRTRIRNHWMAALWFAALLIVTFALPRDTILLVLPVILLLLHDETAVAARASTDVLAVLCALAALVKISSLVVAIVVLTIVTAADLARRRVPRHLLIFGVAFLGLYLAAGRTFAALPLWIRGSAHIVARFGEAWPLAGNIHLLPVALLGAAVVLLAANEARLEHGHPIAIAVIGAAFLKAGIGRADEFHLLISRTSVLALVVLCAPRLIGRYSALIATALAVAAIVPVIDARAFVRQTAAALHPIPAYRASVQLFSQEMQAIRRITPLPNVRGSVDWFDARQCVVIANGLAYAPRPVFQSLNVADAELAAINASYLSGSAAPPWLFFEPLPIDDRYPASEDSLSWRERLTRYDLAGVARGVALLRRRDTPKAWQSQRAGVVTTDFDRPVGVPGGGPLWVSIDIRPSLRGRIGSVFSGLPPVHLEVVTANGTRRRFRIIPSIARGGFLLSPLVASARSYAALSVGRADLLQPLEVRTLRVVTEHPSAFRREIVVHFDRVTF